MQKEFRIVNDSRELSLAQQIDADARETAVPMFGRMIVCTDADAARQVAERLAADGHRVLWSWRINEDRVLLDQPETGIHTRPATA